MEPTTAIGRDRSNTNADEMKRRPESFHRSKFLLQYDSQFFTASANPRSSVDCCEGVQYADENESSMDT